MLKKIKSFYFIKNLFKFLEESKKLKLTKYNKSLQKVIDISINNYIHFKGKYIIYESKGIGKEYFCYKNKLVYVGGILNGQRNGKGKEYYDNGNLKFEGEYLNGQRNGKGKEYRYDKLKFEGEYLNGQRNGKGKKYYDNGNLKFECEYLNGKEFIGNKYDENRNIEYKYNKINGKGKEYFNNGELKFEGEYLNGKKI